MPRIGITGHSNLTTSTVPLVAEAIRATLTKHTTGPIVGITCLARGADQIFARVVLELGGQIEAVLPAADYRERKVKPEQRGRLRRPARQSRIGTHNAIPTIKS